MIPVLNADVLAIIILILPIKCVKHLVCFLSSFLLLRLPLWVRTQLLWLFAFKVLKGEGCAFKMFITWIIEVICIVVAGEYDSLGGWRSGQSACWFQTLLLSDAYTRWCTFGQLMGSLFTRIYDINVPFWHSIGAWIPVSGIPVPRITRNRHISVDVGRHGATIFIPYLRRFNRLLNFLNGR